MTGLGCSPGKGKRVTAGIVAGIFWALSACGLLTHGRSQEIRCTTRPAGALVKLADGTACSTPCTITLNRKKGDTLIIESEGYETITLPLRPVVSKMSAGNMLLPAGIVCWGIDLAFGGAYRLVPERVDVQLIQLKPSLAKAP